MSRVKKIIWAIAGGLASWVIAPAAFADSFNQSDISGTNVFNNTAIEFGFEPLAKSGLVTPAVQQLQTAIAALINSDATSTGSKTALTALSQRLNTLNGKIWSFRGELDATLRSSADQLSKELATASAQCINGDNRECSKLNQLTQQINQFLNEVENLRAALKKHAQVSRTF